MELEEALHNLLAAISPLPVERVSVWDAGGRVAAEDINAPTPVPHFPRAAMDGYLCHDADVQEASPGHPVQLRITGAVQMGEPPGIGPGRGEAWTITTGGAIPGQGDRVLPLEDGRLVGEHLRLERPVGSKSNIAAAGEDIRPGARLVTSGEVVPAPAAGALAACGISHVSVHRRPRLSLIATGTELVEVAGVAGLPPAPLRGERPALPAGLPPAGPAGLPPGRVVNSNSITLAGALRAAGYAVVYKGIVADRPGELRETFARALADAHDVIVSTGGVSVGRYDAVHRTWLDLGAQRIVGHVDLKPGGPFFAGRFADAWTIGLSGTPVACLAAFHLLVLPFLRRLEGRRHCIRPQRIGVLATGFPRATDRMRALWGRVEEQNDDLPAVRLLIGESEGNLASLLSANALALIPPDTPPLTPGTRLTVLMLGHAEDRDHLTIRRPSPGPLAVGVVGESDSGKTTVIAGLLRRLVPDGVRTVAVKHAAHGFALDRPGSDSARMAEAGAAIVVLAGPTETVVRIAAPLDDPDRLVRLAEASAVRAWGDPPDCILIEGFDHPARPVIQVGRPERRTAAGEVLASVPGIADMSAAQVDAALDLLAGAVRDRLALRGRALAQRGARGASGASGASTER